MQTENNASKPLTRMQKIGVCLLLLFTLGLGAVVELRGALQNTRKTDLGVYLRAAWAIRSGNDPYAISDNNGWHYVYPPLFAIVMVPLADPPAGVDRVGYLPYAFSVGLWYVLTMMLGCAGVHLLAKALEETSGDPAVRGQPRFCRRWWALRLLPLLVLLPAIGRSQMRGQVGLVIAFLLCGMAAALLRGWRVRSGIWLAAAVCIKIIPAFLLILPLWRRDWRMLTGILTGLALGLMVIPLVALGPQKTRNAYEAFYQETLLPGITGDTAGSRGVELTGITSTDSNSPMAVVHNIMYPSRQARPGVTLAAVRVAHWILAVLLTIGTVWAAGPQNRYITASCSRKTGGTEATSREVIFMGALLLLMMISSPVFHPHYLSMALPLITAMFSVLWDRNGYPDIPVGWSILFISLFAGHVVTSIGGIFWWTRDFGLVLLTTLSLWAGCITLLRQTRPDHGLLPQSRTR